MTVKHLDHLNLSVESLDATADFYRRLFGFEEVERGESSGVPYCILRSGEAMLCAYEHPGWSFPEKAARRAEGVHGINHFSFRITDREAWEATLEREQVPVYFGGEVRQPHSSAWYLDDPTGYEIEVALWDDDVIRFEAR